MALLIVLLLFHLFRFINMCIKPITIRNKYNYSRSYQTQLGEVTLDPSGRIKIQVPCGHCWQCLQSKTDSWVFRCQCEYEYCKNKALFITLTYDKKHLPTHPYKRSPESLVEFVSVWDKSACQRYLKSLNEKVIYYIGKSFGLTRLSHGRLTDEWRQFLDVCPSRPFSYLLTCERGSFDSYVSDSGRTRFGTARPHYHCILFIRPFSFTFRGNSYTFFDFFSMSSLQELCVNLWKKGSCYPLVIEPSTRSLSPYDRSPLSAIRYVCKYVSKDCNYDYKDIPMSKLVWINHRQKLNSLPFTLFSNYLGLDWFYSSDFQQNYLKYLEHGVTVYSGPGKTRQINPPLYYLNRLRFISTPVEKFTVNSLVKTENGWPYSDTFQRYSTYSEIRSVLQKVNVPTVYNDEISRNLLHRKAEYYVSLLDSIRHLPSTYFRSLFSSDNDLLGCYAFLKRNLSSVSSDDFYQFIVEELYTFDSSYTVPDPYSHSSYFTCLFEFLTDYKNFLKKLDHVAKKLLFKSNLSISMVKKPNLFNVKSLEFIENE